MSEHARNEEDFREPYLERVRALIEECGWALQGVFPRAEHPEDGSDLWIYTVGLAQRFGHPELVIVNLPQAVSASILNALGDRIKDGARFEHGSVISGAANVDLQAVVVTEGLLPGEDGRFGTAWAIEDRVLGDVGVLQLVWPDAAGLLPWEDGYDASMAQPLWGPAPTPGGEVTAAS